MGHAPKLLLASLLVCFLGLALLGFKALGTYRIDWLAARTLLPAQSDAVVNAEFVAQVGGFHEVVIEYDSVLPERQLTERLTRTGDQAASDVSWTVTKDGQPFAAGGSNRLLYSSSGGRTGLGRIKRWLLSIPFHRDGASFIQVVGRFRASPDSRYALAAELRSIDPVFVKARARMAVRPGRELWNDHHGSTVAIAYAGLAFVALGLVLGGLAILMVLYVRLRPAVT